MTDIFLPGDLLPQTSAHCGGTLIVGRGIVKRVGADDELVAVQAGIRNVAGGKQWLDVHSRRYVPQKGDRVIGIVCPNYGGDVFKIDLGSADHGSVNYLSFEGATKRNRPILRSGDLIYATVISSSKHAEPELTCVDSEGRARGMGLLPSHGFVFRCSINLVRRILSTSSRLLFLIGYHLKFEIACGINGRIWIAGANPNEIGAIYRIIRDSEFIPESDIGSFVEERIGTLRGLSIA